MLHGKAINQPSASPSTKVAAGTMAGAVTVVLVYVLSLAHIDVPPDVASAFTVIFSFATSYVVKHRVADTMPLSRN